MTETTTPNSLPAASAELSLDLIITCADGLEAPLQTELTSFGIASEIKSTGRLAVTGTLRPIHHLLMVAGCVTGIDADQTQKHQY